MRLSVYWREMPSQFRQQTEFQEEVDGLSCFEQTQIGNLGQKPSALAWRDWLEQNRLGSIVDDISLSIARIPIRDSRPVRGGRGGAAVRMRGRQGNSRELAARGHQRILTRAGKKASASYGSGDFGKRPRREAVRTVLALPGLERRALRLLPALYPARAEGNDHQHVRWRGALAELDLLNVGRADATVVHLPLERWPVLGAEAVGHDGAQNIASPLICPVGRPRGDVRSRCTPSRASRRRDRGHPGAGRTP